MRATQSLGRGRDGGGTQSPQQPPRQQPQDRTTAPRPGFAAALGDSGPGNAGLMGNRKSAALAQLEHGVQFPGTWRGQGQDHTGVCALLISGAPSALPCWCPYLPHPWEPPRAWSQLTAGHPHPPDLPVELGLDSSKTEMEVLKGPSPLKRAAGGQGHATHPETPTRGQSSDSPPPAPPSLQAHPECRSPGPPRRSSACSHPRP